MINSFYIKKPGVRWLMLMFAFAATVINYLDRLAFNFLSSESYLRKLIPDDYFGYISASFFIAYMISNGVSGFVIDRLGTKLGYSLYMFFWSTASVLHALATLPLHFGIFRFFLGIGEAGNWPAAIKLISEWFPAKERATASGIFNSGAAIGAMLAPPLIGWLVITYSWRLTFVIVGALGYIWLVVFWLYYRPPSNLKIERDKTVIPARLLLRNNFVLIFALAKFLIDPVWYFITFWIGRYLADVHGWGISKIGIFAVLPFIAADVGNIAGGIFTHFIIKNGGGIPVARKVAVGLFGSLLAFSLIFGPLIITTATSAIIILAIASFSYAALVANMMAFPADAVPHAAVASVYGLGSVGSGLGGAFFQFVSGLAISAISVSYDYNTAYTSVFTAYGFVTLAGVAILIFLIGPLQKDSRLQNYTIENS